MSTYCVANCAITQNQGGVIVKKKTSIPYSVIEFGKDNEKFITIMEELVGMLDKNRTIY